MTIKAGDRIIVVRTSEDPIQEQEVDQEEYEVIAAPNDDGKDKDGAQHLTLKVKAVS